MYHLFRAVMWGTILWMGVEALHQTESYAFMIIVQVVFYLLFKVLEMGMGFDGQ